MSIDKVEAQLDRLADKVDDKFDTLNRSMNDGFSKMVERCEDHQRQCRGDIFPKLNQAGERLAILETHSHKVGNGLAEFHRKYEKEKNGPVKIIPFMGAFWKIVLAALITGAALASGAWHLLGNIPKVVGG